DDIDAVDSCRGGAFFRPFRGDGFLRAFLDGLDPEILLVLFLDLGDNRIGVLDRLLAEKLGLVLNLARLALLSPHRIGQQQKSAEDDGQTDFVRRMQHRPISVVEARVVSTSSYSPLLSYYW